MTFVARPSVLWREGLFLCPQHLQTFGRELEGRAIAAERHGSPGPYGVASLVIDEEPLERDEFRVESAQIIFRDGSLAVFPATAEVPQRSFAAAFVGGSLDVHLGIPARRRGVAEVGADGRRYKADIAEVYDEVEGKSAREVDVRILQGRLFFGDEDRSGYETLPIARLVRRGRPVARSVVADFIPPAVAAGGSQTLMRLLAELAEAVRAQSRDLAARIPQTAALSSVEKGADLAGFVKLQAVNQSVATLEQLRERPELHPFFAYMELVRVVGNLSIFGDERVVAPLPVYNHDQLDACFTRIGDVVRSLIVADVSVPYDTVPFKKDALRRGLFEVEVPADWLTGTSLIFLGIEAPLAPEDAAAQVLSSVKLLASRDLDRVLQGVVPGIALEHVRTPPMAFPKRDGLHYFRIETEGDSREGWRAVLEDRLATVISTLGAAGEVQFHLYVELHE